MIKAKNHRGMFSADVEQTEPFSHHLHSIFFLFFALTLSSRSVNVCRLFDGGNIMTMMAMTTARREEKMRNISRVKYYF